jgi:hypothetical protein
MLPTNYCLPSNRARRSRQWESIREGDGERVIAGFFELAFRQSWMLFSCNEVKARAQSGPRRSRLQIDAECEVHARIARIAQVVNAIDFDNVDVLRV